MFVCVQNIIRSYFSTKNNYDCVLSYLYHLHVRFFIIFYNNILLVKTKLYLNNNGIFSIST